MEIRRRTLLKAGSVALAGSAAAIGLSSCKGDKQETAKGKVKKPFAKDPDVVVIGAGLSGLNATLLLEEMGYNVTLVEGRDRVGGRLYTLDDVPGAPEAGGAGIGSIYGRLLGTIRRYDIPMGLERARTIPVPEISMLTINGTHIPFDKWADHPLNPFPKEYKEKLPGSMQYGLYGDDNPLSAPGDILDSNLNLESFDISVYEHFKKKGFSEKATQLAAGTNMSYSDVNGKFGLSALLMYHVIAFGRMASGGGETQAGAGGNQRIPEGMANNVKTDIHLDTKVIGIRHENSHAEIHLENGQILKAKQVIVTAPFSALRLIGLDAPMHPLKRQAIATMGYTNVTHLHFIPTRKFWEDDGLAPSMWCDGPIGRFMALRNDPSNPEEITSFIAFTNDALANHHDRLGPEASAQFMLNYLEQIRPSTKGALKFAKYWSWQLDPFAGGAYAAWRPGQITKFGQHVATPAGRIHFAGEHTEFNNRGMESAMESGERAAFAVAEQLG
ncbi:NAD(P)/FAD-dependent oxidoreductase [Sphingorhabdus sp. EL138]|uniref:flavin monoamine oxidase family protein n=1 Tax=Sphingorhabdus sp. EL138 TaxID=2073156 RepID=UPI0013A5463A|nr:NAD(P)/FAD-dependent oxidoreductase [Sphingorhabdus sp. EL138]